MDISDLVRLRLKSVETKVESEMMELQVLETDLNRVKDFTGSRPKMSLTTSYGTWSRIG